MRQPLTSADGNSDCYSVCRLVLGRQTNGRLLAALVAQVAAAAKAESKTLQKRQLEGSGDRLQIVTEITDYYYLAD
jgi:hypothetical protein